MSTLEISDTFDPYYAGRKAFACPSRNSPAAAAERLTEKDRDGSETIAAGVARLPRADADAQRARSATSASSTIMPCGVARRRELPTGATSPSSCSSASRRGDNGRPASVS